MYNIATTLSLVIAFLVVLFILVIYILNFSKANNKNQPLIQYFSHQHNEKCRLSDGTLS